MAATKTEKTSKNGQISVDPASSQQSAKAKAKMKPVKAADGPKPKPKPRTTKRRLPPSARLVAEVRSGLGVTREFFARMTGFSVRAIAAWETGGALSEAALARIMEMKRLRDALGDRILAGFIPEWLQNPCEGLGGAKPIEILERGETDRLWRVVLLIGSGTPT